MHEMTHAERATGVRQLITESPNDIKTKMKVVLENPDNGRTFMREVTDDDRWIKWGEIQFFKHYNFLGKKFEGIVNDIISLRNGPEFVALNNKIKQMTNNVFDLTNPNIDVFSNVQLKFTNQAGEDVYFVADQLIVKKAWDNIKDDMVIDNICILETKLKQTTNASNRQVEAFNVAENGYELRNLERKGMLKNFDLEKDIDNSKLNFKDGIINFYKLFDGETGNTINDIGNLIN